MLCVLGYPGSGTKYVSRMVHAAVGGGWDEEKLPRDPEAGLLFGGYDEDRLPYAERTFLKWQENGGKQVNVYKEEFAVPYLCHLLDPAKTVYILRNTMANVHFLMTWKNGKWWQGWTWYFAGIITAAGENVPEEPAAMLALAHRIQTYHDRHEAMVRGIPVFRYEDLCANCTTEFPRLFAHLGVELTEKAQKAILEARSNPETQFASMDFIRQLGGD